MSVEGFTNIMHIFNLLLVTWVLYPSNYIFPTSKLFSFSNSTSSALAKLSKTSTSVGSLKQQPAEKKETPQERLKRIMSKQLNKQSMFRNSCIEK